MKLLILGGTQFVGRHLTRQALDRGDSVSLFHRGKTNPDLFPEAEHLFGDREGNLDVLAGGTWDVVIDTSGYTPEAVSATSALLRERVGHYVFVSTISVYADMSQPDTNEDAPVATLPPDAPRALSNETYGALKAECEDAVRHVYRDRALIVRPGLIVGPFDPTDRFTYWPVRIGMGGEVLVPDAPTAPIQWIDGRDLAAWMLNMAQAGKTGTFNATGPEQPYTLAALVERCRALLEPAATLVPVAEEFLVRHAVGPFVELPFWLPAQMQGLLAVDCSRAQAAGLRYRAVDETLHDTYAWRAPTVAEQPLRAGLTKTREEELLQLWRTERAN